MVCSARVDAHALMQCKAARHRLLSKLQPMSRRYGEALFLDAISCRHFRGIIFAVSLPLRQPPPRGQRHCRARHDVPAGLPHGENHRLRNSKMQSSRYPHLQHWNSCLQRHWSSRYQHSPRPHSLRSPHYCLHPYCLHSYWQHPRTAATQRRPGRKQPALIHCQLQLHQSRFHWQ